MTKQYRVYTGSGAGFTQEVAQVLHRKWYRVYTGSGIKFTHRNCEIG